MIRILLLAALAVLLSACGTAHVRTDYAAPMLDSYAQIHVEDVDVNSTEQEAKLLRLNDQFSEYARKRLEAAVEETGIYQLVDAGLASQGDTLVAETRIDITYGSRAKRWWMGFGAGKGAVHSVLILRNRLTGEEVLRLASGSDLALGAFGGSMDKTIRENIDVLVMEFKQSLL